MRVIWTVPALEYLDDIFDDIVLDSPRNAKAVITRIRLATRNLADFPLMGRQSEDYDGLRELVIPKTSNIVFYRVSSDKIEIVAVLNGAQQRPDAF